MKRKLFAIACIMTFVLAITYFVVGMLRVPIDRHAYNEIRIGMSEQEVACVLPVEPFEFPSRAGTYPCEHAEGAHGRVNFTSTESAPGVRVLVDRTSGQPFATERRWVTRQYGIWVTFDLNGRVIYKACAPAPRPGETRSELLWRVVRDALPW